MTADPQAGDRVMVLSGGVGGAKLVLGFARILDAQELLVVANTADDFRHLGLQVSPDIDTLIYTLAGRADQDKGWGLAGETWTFMQALAALGGETWFNLGDGDLAMHVERTRRLADGESLTAVTAALAAALDVTVPILPMSDDPVATIVETADGPLAFQHYFVRDRCAPTVTGFRFEGLTEAQPNPLVMQDLASGQVRAIVIAPSNPFVSVDPILGLPGLREALLAQAAPRIAVSPIVGGAAIKGPAAKMMQELGMPVTAVEVARHYAGLIDAIVIDDADSGQLDEIIALGVEVMVTRTVMRTIDDRKSLAACCLTLARMLSER